MKGSNNFKLGDRVEVSGIIEKTRRQLFGKHYMFWRKSKTEPVTGIVVRRVWKRGGIHIPAYTSYGWDGPDEQVPGELRIKRQYLCYEIATNLHRKPILVQASQIQRWVDYDEISENDGKYGASDETTQPLFKCLPETKELIDAEDQGPEVSGTFEPA